MQLTNTMKSLFQLIKPKSRDKSDEEYRWCIIGNIASSYLYGEEKKIKKGTKHFRAGTKVYCFLEYGGMANERIVVVGQHRKSRRFIKLAMDPQLLSNFRVKKVYQPNIIGHINQSPFYWNFKNSKYTESELNKYIQYLNSNSREIKTAHNT